MAAIGSAVGLGNVWRFPYVVYENGGGAFFIPYLIALFTCGIPLLILEFSLGHWSRGSAPQTFKKIGKKWEWLGWWPLFIAFFIVTYYTVVMAWCFNYLIYSFDLRWGTDAAGFFLTEFLGKTAAPEILGNIQLPVILGLVAIWTMIYLIIRKGVKGIGKIVLITVPLPWILLIILTIRGLTLPGAIEGINYYLTPDFSKLGDLTVWISAYSQIFFSLSLAAGVMITYASFLPKKSDINNNAFITSLANCGTSFFAGFAVFSVLGYLAYSYSIPLQNIASVGPELAFVAYPTAISLLPIGASIIGLIFFVALLTFGIDSAFSLVEPIQVGLTEKWKLSKEKITGIICLIGFLAGVIFTTGSGLMWLDIVDYFMANFGLAMVALFECIVIGWILLPRKLRNHANTVSEIRIGVWWEYLIRYINPIILAVLIIWAAWQKIFTPDWDYSTLAIFAGGVSLTVIAIILSFIITRIKTKEEL